MSRIYTQQKRPGAKAAEPSYSAPPTHTPSMVSGASSADLDAMMQAKFQQHFLDNQIPHAEAEADRLAASVSGARTPEEVKSQLGEKMGADFSNVTFHTDSAALKQADAMGARAYTSGSDVYFGSGGFDPGVAAHELVHTVQQGMVGSTMQTTSAPTGGVQMKPSLFSRIKAAWRDPTSMLHPFQRHDAAKEAMAMSHNREATKAYNAVIKEGPQGGEDVKENIRRAQKASLEARTEKYSLNPLKRHRQVKEKLAWSKKEKAEPKHRDVFY